MAYAAAMGCGWLVRWLAGWLQALCTYVCTRFSAPVFAGVTSIIDVTIRTIDPTHSLSVKPPNAPVNQHFAFSLPWPRQAHLKISSALQTQLLSHHAPPPSMPSMPSMSSQGHSTPSRLSKRPPTGDPPAEDRLRLLDWSLPF